MRVSAFEVRSTGPIKLVSVSSLADVVVLAGPNGVGKTNINNALLRAARDPGSDRNVWMVVEATDESERQRWGKSALDTRISSDAQILRSALQRNQRRNKYESSFLNFDSDRAVRNVQNFGFSWDIGDPLAEEVGWDLGLQSLQTRYNDVRHSLFRLVESQKRQIADTVLTMQAGDPGPITLERFPDVLAPYKEAFWRLLGPKKLLEVNTREQEIYYEHNGSRLSFGNLSSGEREVVNIVFDFLLRGPRNCVVVFDEPELHLHPELSYRLLQTLSSIGRGNQFVFSTHSPEIISASLENSVIFITPPRSESDNQALIVHRDDATHHALQALGQSIGVISLGKNLVLIEGDETSLDKQTYGAILKNRFPEFVLVPVGGREGIESFADVRAGILDKTIWGVNFYLLCDRDASVALPNADSIPELAGKVRVLPRYHLENYFLDEEVLATVFSQMEPTDSWLRDPLAIQAKLQEIALSVVPYAVALNVSARVRQAVGNVSIMPKGSASMTAETLVAAMGQRVDAERARTNDLLETASTQRLIAEEFDRLKRAIESGDSNWRQDIPGRIVLNKFAGVAKIQVGRLKQLYLASANQETVFGDIVEIFEGFRRGT